MNRLKELRKSIGMTQEGLGKVFGVSGMTISGYETGKRAPDFEMLVRIADYFGVSTDYLLERTDEREPNPEPEEQPFIAPLMAPGYDELTPDDRLKVIGYVQRLREEAKERQKAEIERAKGNK